MGESRGVQSYLQSTKRRRTWSGGLEPFSIAGVLNRAGEAADVELLAGVLLLRLGPRLVLAWLCSLHVI